MRNPGGENFDRKYILPLKKYSLSLSLSKTKKYDVSQATIIRGEAYKSL